MSAPTLQPSPLPADWSTWTDDKKLTWLDTQPLPEDPTISLGSVYRRGAIVSASLHLAYDGLANLQQQFAAKTSDDKGKRALAALIRAFNALVSTFGNAQYADYSRLLVDGSLGKQLPPPLKTGPFQPITKDTKPVGMVEMLKNALAIILTTNPELGTVKPGLGVASYADIIQAVIIAAKEFIDVWNGKDLGSASFALEEEGEAKEGSEDQGDVPEDIHVPQVQHMPPMLPQI